MNYQQQFGMYGSKPNSMSQWGMTTPVNGGSQYGGGNGAVAPTYTPMTGPQAVRDMTGSFGSSTAGADWGTYSGGGNYANYTTGSGVGIGGAGAPGAGGGNWWDGALGSTDKNGIRSDGWGGTALSGVQGVANLWMGMQQYGLAKDSLDFNKAKYASDFSAQKNLTNSSLEDRQRRRVLEDPTRAVSVSDYMAKYGIK